MKTGQRSNCRCPYEKEVWNIDCLFLAQKYIRLGIGCQIQDLMRVYAYQNVAIYDYPTFKQTRKGHLIKFEIIITIPK